MASAEMCECSDSESPSSNANTGKSKQEIQEELAVECEKTWQHIQDVIYYSTLYVIFYSQWLRIFWQTSRPIFYVCLRIDASQAGKPQGK